MTRVHRTGCLHFQVVSAAFALLHARHAAEHVEGMISFIPHKNSKSKDYSYPQCIREKTEARRRGSDVSRLTGPGRDGAEIGIQVHPSPFS